jgi:hypothetical protein
VRRERFLERIGDQVLSSEDRHGNDRRRDAPTLPTCVCVVKA